jgi:hypothetical protein
LGTSKFLAGHALGNDISSGTVSLTLIRRSSDRCKTQPQVRLHHIRRHPASGGIHLPQIPLRRN